MKEDFDINEYYRGCCGIIRSKEEAGKSCVESLLWWP